MTQNTQAVGLGTVGNICRQMQRAHIALPTGKGKAVVYVHHQHNAKRQARCHLIGVKDGQSADDSYVQS